MENIKETLSPYSTSHIYTKEGLITERTKKNASKISIFDEVISIGILATFSVTLFSNIQGNGPYFSTKTKSSPLPNHCKTKQLAKQAHYFALTKAGIYPVSGGEKLTVSYYKCCT